MSVLDALYKTYNEACSKNMVDRTDRIHQEAVLLPIYHSSKKSMGTNDIIEVFLSESGVFLKAEWLPKDQIVIFPVTENSIIRSGSTIAPHPLCDELSYLSTEYNVDKHAEYSTVLEDWVSYGEDGNEKQLLQTIYTYIQGGTILKDCISSLFGGYSYQIAEDFSVEVSQGEKARKTIHLEKTFVTFRIEAKRAAAVNPSVTESRELHQYYIEYIRSRNREKPQLKCDISGEMTYCVSRHRGLMGNAKLISISNHNETYYGRFDDGEEVVHIGYEASQKIHLMLKYLLENGANRRKLNNSCMLVNWFSDDIGNEEQLLLTEAITLYDDLDEEEAEKVPATLGGGISAGLNDYLTGRKKESNYGDKFYLMILDKISNGRISVKYFRELPRSDLFERVEMWYQTTKWPIFNGKLKKTVYQTPSIFRYIDAIYGLENEKGYLEVRSDKLKAKALERLLPCILEHKNFPVDLKNKMLENLCNRGSYDKSWNTVVEIGCSIFKKYQMDHQEKKEVKEQLDDKLQNRSYLYGRLLAVFEKLEQDALDMNKGKMEEGKSIARRITNAERLWTAYTKMPARTLQIIINKISPYKERLKKNNYGAAINYERLTTEIINQLAELESFEKNKNKALNEDFIFGYYHQKKEFYKKHEKNNDVE